MPNRIAVFASLLCLGTSAIAADYVVETVADGLSYPWSVAVLDDGSLLVTERTGQLRRVGPSGDVSEPVEGVPSVYFAGQGGLHDIVLDPGFENNRTVYLSYAEGTPGENRTAVARAVLSASSLDNVEVIFRVTPGKDTPVHYGARLAFLQDGTLLLTTGDGFDYRESAQDIRSGLGKVIRINTDGSAAAGNPFPESPFVWSYGLRNPQGLAVARDGTVYLHDHGPAGGDEVNVIEAGVNYGWPAITYGLDYNGAYVSPYTEWDDMQQPLHYWTPSIAPSGLAVYEGDMFPEWQGDLFVGALVDREVRRLEIDAGSVSKEERAFTEIDSRVRDVRVGPDGAIYVVTDGEDGKVLRISRSARD
jgi:glucose/arabinose dehydrogenase